MIVLGNIQMCSGQEKWLCWVIFRCCVVLRPDKTVVLGNIQMCSGQEKWLCWVMFRCVQARQNGCVG